MRLAYCSLLTCFAVSYGICWLFSEQSANCKVWHSILFTYIRNQRLFSHIYICSFLFFFFNFFAFIHFAAYYHDTHVLVCVPSIYSVALFISAAISVLGTARFFRTCVRLLCIAMLMRQCWIHIFISTKIENIHIHACVCIQNRNNKNSKCTMR